MAALFRRLWSRLVMGRRVESDLVGPIAGLVLTESAAQRIEDCQALSHQAGGDLAEPVGAVEDCQVCPDRPWAACLTISGSWSISIRSKATRLCEAAASA